MPVPELPPEAYDLSTKEVAELTSFSDYKVLGSLLLSLREGCPVEGLDPTCEPDGIHMRLGSFDEHIMMHVDRFRGLQQLRRDVVCAATYIQLQPVYHDYRAVVGVTYSQMANLAARAFGFRVIRPIHINDSFLISLRDFYEGLPISNRQSFEPRVVYMPTMEVIDRFGAKHLGTNARQLRQKIVLGEPLPRYEQMQQPATGDPVLRAIRSTIDTMGNDT